jgi:hypothetical protein
LSSCLRHGWEWTGRLVVKAQGRSGVRRGVSVLVDLSREELIAYGLQQQARVAELVAQNVLQDGALEQVRAAYGGVDRRS